MKTIMTVVFTVLAGSAFALTETVDGITWTYTISNGVATLGGESSSSTAVPKYSTTGPIIIPKSLGGCTVTSIGKSAFWECRRLTSVTIPDCVTSIGDYAFSSCSGLTSATIPDSVTSIGQHAFNSCSGLTSVIIPDSVTNIGQYAFYSCSGLTSVIIPDSVTSIGQYAFSSCSSLMSVTIPNSVTSIAEYMFSSCSRLMSVTIPNSVTNIGQFAFSSCSGLTSVEIPDSVTHIGSSAFVSCSALTSVTIPQVVCSSSLRSVFKDSPITNVVISDGVTNIAQQAFSDCSNLKSIVIGREVESIASDAFRYCSALVSVIIPQVVCNSKLSSVFPSSYQSITNVVICDGVANIGEGAFDACGSLKNVEIPNSITNIGRYAFRDCSSVQSARIPNSVAGIGDYAFCNCSALTDVAIPDTVARIGVRAFSNCSNITQIVIPDSVISVGTCAFAYCSKLGRAEVGCGSIGYQAFLNCTALTNVTLGIRVNSIGELAFSNVKGDIVISPDIGMARLSVGRYACDVDANIVQPSKNGVDFVWISDSGDDVVNPFRSEVGITVTPFWRVKSVIANPSSDVEFENTSETVTLSCPTPDAIILYTTDGSDPSENGIVYKRSFNVYKSCLVRAVAIKDGYRNSTEVTATFTRAESLSEAANLYGYTMESDANAPWVVDTDVSHDGVSSVRSGTIGNNGVTTLSVSLRKTGTVSFWWRAKCEDAEEEGGETYYYDYGSFAVDGNVVARIAGNDTGWQHVSHEITTGGKHVLSWEYRKDGATSYAPDCIWVDQVQWIPADGSGYTLTTPEPVPYAWLDQYNLGVGTDYETAGNAASGKMNWGKLSAVWEEYVAGLDPTNANSRFLANIEMRDGSPFVSWTPDLNTNGIIRTYKVYGSETLENGGNWQYPTNSLHRFFKVRVEMP